VASGVNDAVSSEYGYLLEPIHTSDVQIEVDKADKQVNFWMIAGAISAICYAIALCVLAISHQSYTGYAESFVSFLMFASKLIVAFCAQKVHCNLSKDARGIVGRWVWVLAVSKLCMAICGFCQGTGYLLAALVSSAPSEPNPEDSSFCVVLFFFTLIMLSTIVFQTSAAFALFRIQQLALSAMVDTKGTGCVVGWWVVLVSSTFGVGLMLWACGGIPT